MNNYLIPKLTLLGLISIFSLSCSPKTYQVIISTENNPLTQFDNVVSRVKLSYDDLLRIDEICRIKGVELINDENKDFDEYFKHYTRQYYGYIGNDNDRWAIINLLNFKGVNMDYYPDWESELILGLGEFYEKNTRRFHVNISREEIEIY